VMHTGYADFWELYKRNVLPTATKNYVPGIIAAAIMAKNPKQYGLEGMVPDPPVVSDTLDVDYAVDLRLVADVTDVSLGEIVELNPSLLRMTTPQDTDFDLHIPAGTHDLYLKRIQAIPQDKRTSWRFHVVRAGESLESIATTFHDRPSEIASANALAQDASVNTGEELVVPVSSAIAIPHPLHYITRPGDTLVTVADRFNVSVENLRRWNQLSSSTIKPNRSLYVSQPLHLAPAAHVRAKKSHPAAGTPVATKSRTTSAHATTTIKTTHPAVASKSTAKASSPSTTTKKKTARPKPTTASK
jgi:membrane-bound lytic murein transglycosylase D